jgi:cysteine desulfurase
MLSFLTESFGNASSAHSYGRVVRAALDEAHERLAKGLNAEPREVVITSGGTEANNLALKGAAWAGKARGHRIVTSSIEHHAVGHTLRYLEKFGFEIVELPVDRYGRVDPEQLEAELTDRTILVTVMLANNEVGTIQPIAEIARRVHGRKGVLLHVDAVQAAPYIDLDMATLGADLVSLGAHKFEGPKGVGALYVRHGTHILAQQQGGSQERHRRAGTENVAGAVGLATAYELTCAERPATVARLRRLRERLSKSVLAVAGTELTGHPKQRLPGLFSMVARDTDGASVALSLDLEGIACSVGSACTTGSTEVSHVLTAMGYPEEEARGALRLSLGRTTTEDEIATACEVVPRVVASMRLGAAAVAADPLGQGVPA